MRTIDDCPACGSTDTVIEAELRAEQRTRFVAFSQAKYAGLLESWLEEIPPLVLSCAHCGHCWYRHQPEPEQLREMCAAGRPLTPGGGPSREPSAQMIAEMNRLRLLVDWRGAAPTLLDYGSGFGCWARAAVQVGFEVTAFEPSTERGADEQVPFELVHEFSRLQDCHFVAIQLEQVLDHVRDPLRVLEEIKAFCDPDTVVRITVPNILRALEGKNLWAAWPFDGKAPHILTLFEHLHGFTPISLDRLLGRAGFKSVSWTGLWCHYPLGQVRWLLGRLVPSLGSTLRLVSPV